jgi:aldehyde dehydrogenase (NAD+)
MNSERAKAVLTRFGIKEINSGVTTGTVWYDSRGDITPSESPIDGSIIAKVKNATIEDYEKVIKTAQEAFLIWRSIPAPKRGEIVRQIGLAIRDTKEDLGYLVSMEMGKIYQEGLGEVQEMIDICDYAVGQSRQLYGFTMQSERKEHRMFDQYLPLGTVGLVTSFNFPVAVWSWNAMLAAVAGDVVIWKPSSKTPLCAIATHRIIEKVLKDNRLPEGIFNLVIAKSSVLGDHFVADKRIPLISITSSTAVGKRVGEIVGRRLGRAILELGGNNAVIVSENADLDMAITSILFGAVGTCGQRCTSTRRIIVHEKVYEEVKRRLMLAYKQFGKKIGNPLDSHILVGPLVDQDAVKAFMNAVEQVQEEGGKLMYGGYALEGERHKSGNYVVPAFVEAENHYKIVQEETFAPILYMMKYKCKR